MQGGWTVSRIRERRAKAALTAMSSNDPPAATPAGGLPSDRVALGEEQFEGVIQAAERGASPIGAWLAPLVAPPLIGLGLIVSVVGGVGNATLTNSPGAVSAALAVGALLILGSAGLYVLSPKRYDHFFTDLRKRIEAGAAGIDRQLLKAPSDDPPQGAIIAPPRQGG